MTGMYYILISVQKCHVRLNLGRFPTITGLWIDEIRKLRGWLINI